MFGTTTSAVPPASSRMSAHRPFGLLCVPGDQSLLTWSSIAVGHASTSGEVVPSWNVEVMKSVSSGFSALRYCAAAQVPAV